MYSKNFADILIIIALLIIISLLTTNEIYSQFGNKVYVAAGLSINPFMGDNLADKPMFPRSRDTLEEFYYGGGFIGPNPGITGLIILSLDEEEQLRVPIGISYRLLSAGQKVPITKDIIYYLKHYINLWKISCGFNYYFADFKTASAKMYIGFEPYLSIISGAETQATARNSIGNPVKIMLDDSSEVDIVIKPTKSNATRIGGQLILGAEGQIYEQWYINFFAGLGILNLFGRDNTRGELLNVINDPPRNENFVYTFNLSFLIQYRL